MKKVANKSRKFASAKYYYADWIGDTPLLFTEKDIEIAAYRAQTNPEDVIPKETENNYTLLLVLIIAAVVGLATSLTIQLL